MVLSIKSDTQPLEVFIVVLKRQLQAFQRDKPEYKTSKQIIIIFMKSGITRKELTDYLNCIFVYKLLNLIVNLNLNSDILYKLFNSFNKTSQGG